MLLLAYRLLKKKFPAAWKAARKRGKTKKNMGGEPKETAVSRENVPADGSNPAQCNEAGISAHPHLRPSDQSAAYLSPTQVAKSKVRCHLSNAAAQPLRCTIFWAPALDFICAATSRRDVHDHSVRGVFKGISASDPGACSWALGHIGDARRDVGSLVGTHVRNGCAP